MKNPYKRLTVRQTIDLLVTITDASLDQAWRVKQAKLALVEHLRAIAVDRPASKRKGRP